MERFIEMWRFITDIEEPDYASDEYKDRAFNDIDGLTMVHFIISTARTGMVFFRNH